MIAYEASRPIRSQRWTIWAAFLLGLLFLGLGAPLAAQGDGGSGSVRAERNVELRPNG